MDKSPNTLKYKENSELIYTTYIAEVSNETFTNLYGLIMVKNQENNILETLKSISKVCDSIVVVDTGSTDKTVIHIKNNFPNVRIEYLDWQENYGLMRNLCLKFIPENSWVLFIDSDETLQSNINYSTLHSFLAHIDNNYPGRDKICTVKQMHPGRPAFYHTERFIKNTKTLFYFGYVHEEPRSQKKEGLLRIDTDIQIFNLGSNKDEIQKFTKDVRYSNLLLKNIYDEPTNPRWASLMTPALIDNTHYTVEEYLYNLKKNILIDTDKPISENNVKESFYLSYLLERYIVELIKIQKKETAKLYIDFARRKFPYDANFVVFDSTLFLQNIEIECSNKLEEIVSYTNSLDHTLIHEASEGSEEGISGIVVKLLIMLNRYEQAQNIYSTITDELVKKMLSNDISFRKESYHG